MLVSILMNCYNGESHLKQALDSILGQTFSNWEVIFIDNFSTDRSAEIAKSYGDKIKIYSPPEFCNLGTARNFGLGMCKGKYLAFLDTDDVWHSNKLAEQVAAFEADPTLALNYTSFQCIDEYNNLLSKRLVRNHQSYTRLINKYDINMQSVLLNRDIISIEDLNFDEKLSYNPDFKLFMKICSKYKFSSLAGVHISYRILSNSLSSQLLCRQIKENIKVINYLTGLDSVGFENKEKLIKRKGYYYWKSYLSKSLSKEIDPGIKCFWYLGAFTYKHWVFVPMYIFFPMCLRVFLFKKLYNLKRLS
ncbi:glycosyltransferase family 2 protein [Vibrio rotiferianus]